MISQVTFWVEHGEDTDYLVDFIESTEREYASGDITMIASDFIVDVPPPLCGEYVLGDEDNPCTRPVGHTTPHDWDSDFDTSKDVDAIIAMLDERPTWKMGCNHFDAMRDPAHDCSKW